MQSELESVAGYLPEIVLEMVDLVGFADIEKIINQFGGTTFRFTDGAVYFPRLKSLIGAENAIKLRNYFRAEEVYIPKRILTISRKRKRKVAVRQCLSFAPNTIYQIATPGKL